MTNTPQAGSGVLDALESALNLLESIESDRKARWLLDPTIDKLREAIAAQSRPPIAQDAAPVYFIRPGGARDEHDSSWCEASKEAYDLTPDKWRRVLYATPANMAAGAGGSVGAMPELPELPSNISHVMRRIRACESEVPAQLVLEHALREYARAAIQQAAGAVPEGAMDYALDILVAAGHITREKAFQTRDITRQFYAGSSDHLVPCAGGGEPCEMTPPYKPVATVDGEGRITWHAPIPEEGGNLYCEGDLADAKTRRVQAHLTGADVKAIWSQVIGWDGDRLENFARAIEATHGIGKAPRPESPTSQINPGSATREGGHGS